MEIFLKRSILALLLILPLLSAGIAAINFDDWESEKNYTNFSDLEMVPTGNGGIVYRTDSSTQRSSIVLEAMDQNGKMTGRKVILEEEGSDIFLPDIDEENGTVTISYLKTTGDLLDARTSKHPMCDLFLLTLDAETLEPKGQFQEGKRIASMKVGKYHSGIIAAQNWTYLFIHPLDGTLDLEEAFDSDGFLIEMEGDVLGFYEKSNVSADTTIIAIGKDGSQKMAMVDHSELKIVFTVFDESRIPEDPWSGIGSFIVDPSEPRRCLYFDLYGSKLGSWYSGSIQFDDHEFILLTNEGIYIFWDNPRFVYLPYDSEEPLSEGVDTSLYDINFLWASATPEGNATAAFKGTKDIDDDDTEDMLLIVSFDPERGITEKELDERDQDTMRFYHLDERRAVGIASNDVFTLKAETIVINGADITFPEEVASFTYSGLIISLVSMFLLVPAVGTPAIILSVRVSRHFSYFRGSRKKLESVPRKKLLSAYGKKGRMKTLDSLITGIISKDPDKGLSEAEKENALSLVRIRAVYPLFMLLGILIVICLGYNNSRHPPYVPGVANIIETIALTMIASIIVMEIGSGWSSKGPYKAIILAMVMSLFLGFLSLLIFMTLTLFPILEASRPYLIFSSLVTGIILLSISLPVFLLYHRFKKRSIFFTIGLFTIPLFISLLNIYLTYSLPGNMVPSLTIQDNLVVVGRDLHKIVIFPFIAVSVPILMNGALSFKDLFPGRSITRKLSRSLMFIPFTGAVIFIFLTGLVVTPLLPASADNMGNIGKVILAVISILLSTIGLAYQRKQFKKLDQPLGEGDISRIFIHICYSPVLVAVSGFILSLGLGRYIFWIFLLIAFVQLLAGRSLALKKVCKSIDELKALMKIENRNQDPEIPDNIMERISMSNAPSILPPPPGS